MNNDIIKNSKFKFCQFTGAETCNMCEFRTLKKNTLCKKVNFIRYEIGQITDSYILKTHRNENYNFCVCCGKKKENCFCSRFESDTYNDIRIFYVTIKSINYKSVQF